MSPNSINEHVLLGIASAIKEYSPEMLPIVEEVRTSGMHQPAPLARGSSVYGTIEADVPNDKAEQVLAALEAIVRDHGSQTVFEGWQVNFLILCWRRFMSVQPG